MLNSEFATYSKFDSNNKIYIKEELSELEDPSFVRCSSTNEKLRDNIKKETVIQVEDNGYIFETIPSSSSCEKNLSKIFAENVRSENKEETGILSALQTSTMGLRINFPFDITSKRSFIATSEVNHKKQRKNITLATKMEVLRRFENGERAVDIGVALCLPPTTVRTIRANAEKIRASAKAATPLSVTRIDSKRSGYMWKMEKMLAMWMEEQDQLSVPLSMIVIQQKAKSLFDYIVAKEGVSSPPSFNASRGWYARFKQRYSSHNIKIADEVASSESVIADSFPFELKRLIDEGGYSPKQVFNVDETGLFWKKMPDKTYIAQEEKRTSGFKASKDCLTLLLGGNANGDFKLKPLLISRAANPRALKGYSKDHLPVIYKSNKRAWITGAIFSQWLSVYAAPAFKDYCVRENLDFKIILIVDNAPAHPVNLDDLHENIKVIFLPPNTTDALQPMEQGVIAAFKSFYLRQTFDQLVRTTDAPNKPNIREYWKSYNLLHAIDNIAKAWEDVPQTCMKGVWRNLWSEIQFDTVGFEELIPTINDDTLTLARNAGFDNLQIWDIDQVLQSHANELTTEDLRELAAAAAVEEEDNDDEEPRRTFRTKELAQAFYHIEHGLQMLATQDPNRERSSKIIREVNQSLKYYHDLYEEKKKSDNS